jgi:hypothetical protein
MCPMSQKVSFAKAKDDLNQLFLQKKIPNSSYLN